MSLSVDSRVNCQVLRQRFLRQPCFSVDHDNLSMSSVPQPLQRSRAITHTAERDIKSTRIKVQLAAQRNSPKLELNFPLLQICALIVKQMQGKSYCIHTLFARKTNKSETSDSLAIQQGWKAYLFVLTEVDLTVSYLIWHTTWCDVKCTFCHNSCQGRYRIVVLWSKINFLYCGKRA